MGALFVGGSTSLPEIATSTTASLAGHADLAMSNAIGSVASQTAFLAVADMAFSGSLPKLITALTAVRMGALTLAVGDILGGNAFDTLIVAFSDWVYPGGSLFAAAGQQQIYLLALSVLLTAVLLMGMLHREKHGLANIGLESVLVLVLYVGALVLLALSS